GLGGVLRGAGVAGDGLGWWEGAPLKTTKILPSPKMAGWVPVIRSTMESRAVPIANPSPTAPIRSPVGDLPQHRLETISRLLRANWCDDSGDPTHGPDQLPAPSLT